MVEAYAAMERCAHRLAELCVQGTRHGTNSDILKMVTKCQADMGAVGQVIATALETADDPGEHLDCPLPAAILVITGALMNEASDLMTRATFAIWMGLDY